jgi:hypothetical protein
MFERLERYAGKLARTVLRGRDGGNTVLLPGGTDGNAALLPDSMKLTVMGQMNKGMQKMEARDLIKDVEKQLDSLKHHLWNGNITQALRLIDYLQLVTQHRHRASH